MGFDEYFGALYSNDMQPFALYRNDSVEVAAPADQSQLNVLYTREAVRFIREARDPDQPFLLYFAHNFPHEPLHVDHDHMGRSNAGLYGDVVESIDQGVGEILAALRETDQLENTIIILTSDNGPAYQGSPGHSRGRKAQTFEGGMHVPFVVHWPARIRPGQSSDALAMGVDIFPTLLSWLSLPQPSDRIIDGENLAPLLAGGREAAHDYVYFYAGDTLLAISDGRFKYHVRQPYMYVVSGSMVAAPLREGPWLFDLSIDPDESYDVSSRHPDVATRLREALERRVAEDQVNVRGWIAPSSN
jgi:arylsulfatase A-like enzyme